jgi:hypothetical protein
MKDGSKDLILRHQFTDRGGKEVFQVSTAQVKLPTGEITVSKCLGTFRINMVLGTVEMTKWEHP